MKVNHAFKGNSDCHTYTVHLRPGISRTCFRIMEAVTAQSQVAMGVEIEDLLKAAVVAIQDVCIQNGCFFLLAEADRAEMAKMPHALLKFSQEVHVTWSL